MLSEFVVTQCRIKMNPVPAENYIDWLPQPPVPPSSYLVTAITDSSLQLLLPTPHCNANVHAPSQNCKQYP